MRSNSMLKRIVLLIPLLWSVASHALADEGMWLPWNLGKSQVAKMKQMGLELTPEELFSTSGGSLKDAMVSLDSGSCSGSFISKNGLLLTNHHCAIADIQSHSTLENDYLQKGFWAQEQQQEFPNPGKTASILKRVEDVTPLFDAIMEKDLDLHDRQAKIDSLMTLITDTASRHGRYTAEIKDFYFQNQFYLFVSETFRDVRLVAAPPEKLGQFGSDNDNWVWPRHSADFALYRVYTAPDGSAADYSPNNVPYTPSKFLEISVKGAKQNDFTMIMGYPGETQRFLTSFGIEETANIINPVVNEVRNIKQKIWKNNMHRRHLVNIQYAEKYASSSNYQKYACGQNRSIQKNNLPAQRAALEQQFNEWVKMDSVHNSDYGQILNSAKLLYLLRTDLSKINITTLETLINGPDINTFVLEAFPLFNALSQPVDKVALDSLVSHLKEEGETFFKDFDVEADRQVFEAMITYYRQNLADTVRISDEQLIGKNSDLITLSESIYLKSLFSHPDRFNHFLKNPSLQVLKQDPAFQFMSQVIAFYLPIYNLFDRFDQQMASLMHQYIKGLQAMQPDKDFYPDANSTLRLTYGTIGPYSPSDGVIYQSFTTQKGLLEKYESNKKQYNLPDTLISLFQKTDFGLYQTNHQELPLCFISNNDITGGNSGSAVLNGKGQLIGLAFDGNWEGMASDIEYAPNDQKCICVDMRYVLYLIKELGGHSHLMEEMSLVN